MTIAQLNLLAPIAIGLSVNDMVVKLGTVADLVSVHEGYQDPFPKEVPGPPRFRELAVELHQADLEAANKDRLKMAKKVEKQTEAVVSLTIFGQFAVMKAIKYNDTSYLDNIGLDRRMNVVSLKSALHEQVGTPEIFTVRRGSVTGRLVFKVSAVKGAAHYDIYSCCGDPNDEGSWSLADTFVNTRDIHLDGLDPGKVYYFRVRCLGANGFGPWSTTIKIMVV
jgi:hypothetical protein